MMKQDKALDPLHVLGLRADAVVLDANAITHLIQEFRRRIKRCRTYLHDKVTIKK